jgi:1-acyl-sn-glycerol-3-phosphate acyltransferase
VNWLGLPLLPLRILLALVLTLVLALVGSPLALLSRTRLLGIRLWILKIWCLGNRLIFGFWIRTENRPSQKASRGGVLLVSNHVSYWDAFTLGSIYRKTFVAKQEVRKIPLVGFGALITGLLFVERGHMGSRMATIRTVAGALVRGERVMVFPEGTTAATPELLPFHAGAFKAAIDASELATESISLIPVAISYRGFDHHAWGSENGLVHFLRSASMLWHQARIAYGQPIIVTGTNSSALMAQARGECERLFVEIHAKTNGVRNV